MAARFHINEARLLQYHEDMMDEVYLLYHTYPTNFPNYALTPAELAEMSEADALGRSMGRNPGGHEVCAGRKCTTFHRGDTVNGLPRKGR